MKSSSLLDRSSDGTLLCNFKNFLAVIIGVIADIIGWQLLYEVLQFFWNLLFILDVMENIVRL